MDVCEVSFPLCSLCPDCFALQVQFCATSLQRALIRPRSWEEQEVTEEQPEQERVCSSPRSEEERDFEAHLRGRGELFPPVCLRKSRAAFEGARLETS